MTKNQRWIIGLVVVALIAFAFWKKKETDDSGPSPSVGTIAGVTALESFF